MVRMSLAATLLSAMALLAGTGAHAQAASATPSGAVAANAANAATFAAALPAADKVYPPLPSLAMLPPAAAEDEAPAVRSTARRRKGRVAAIAQERRAPPAPVVRLIVSDASHAYLDSVQRQIDEAIAK
jgi:hypothetical protein